MALPCVGAVVLVRVAAVNGAPLPAPGALSRLRGWLRGTTTIGTTIGSRSERRSRARSIDRFDGLVTEGRVDGGAPFLFVRRRSRERNGHRADMECTDAAPVEIVAMDAGCSRIRGEPRRHGPIVARRGGRAELSPPIKPCLIGVMRRCGIGRAEGGGVRVERRRFSLVTDLGSMSHWPLPGRPGCFCFEPDRRPRLSRRQISALVVFMATAVCCAVSQLCEVSTWLSYCSGNYI